MLKQNVIVVLVYKFSSQIETARSAFIIFVKNFGVWNLRKASSTTHTFLKG